MLAPVDGHRDDAVVLRVLRLGGDGEGLPAHGAHGRAREQRSDQVVPPRAELQRVQTQGRQQPPGAHLAVVLVPGIALADLFAHEQPTMHLAHDPGGLLRGAHVVEQEGDVVGGLVGHAELPHPHRPGLDHLVDDPAVAAGTVGPLGGVEELLEPPAQHLAPAVQRGQALPVVGDVEGEVPAVGLGVVPAPGARVVLTRGLREGAVGATSLEELDRGIEQERIVQAPCPQIVRLLPQPYRGGVPLLLGAAREQLGLRGQPRVVDVRLERPGDGFGGVGVDVSGEHRLLVALAAHLGRRRGDGGVAQSGLVGGERIGQRDTLDLEIREGDVAAGAGHAIRPAGSGPAGDPAALAVLLDEAVGELRGQLRVQQRIGGPAGAVGVPEAVVDVHLPRHHLGVGAGGGGMPLGGQHGARVDGLGPLDRAGVLPVRGGVEVQPVEVAVQGAALRGGGVGGLDHPEPLGPGGVRRGPDLLEGALRELLGEGAAALLEAEEAGGQAQRDPAGARREGEHAAGALPARVLDRHRGGLHLPQQVHAGRALGLGMALGG